jgi:hypothetical protein
MAALRAVHLERPNFTPRASPCISQATGAEHDFYLERPNFTPRASPCISQATGAEHDFY